MQEWEEPAAWPKHLVVEYSWQRLEEETPEAALAVLLASGAHPSEVAGP